MGRAALMSRANWQNFAAGRGNEAERNFRDALSLHLQGSDLIGEDSPRDLRGIYGTNIWASGTQGHGIQPDFSIRSEKTSKIIFVEMKRQQARGNAHERACKFMMPGIIESARQIANQPISVIPFWWVFADGIASDPRYRQEILHWFKGIEGHVFLWKDLNDTSALLAHFDQHIKPLLA